MIPSELSSSTLTRQQISQPINPVASDQPAKDLLRRRDTDRDIAIVGITALFGMQGKSSSFNTWFALSFQSWRTQVSKLTKSSGHLIVDETSSNKSSKHLK